MQEIKSPLLDKLNRGVKFSGNEEVDFLPQEVFAFYQWRNGIRRNRVDSIGSLRLFDYGIFIPFEVALSMYRQGVGNVPDWDRFKFPLFITGGGEYYLLECNPGSKEFGMIFFHSIGAIDFDMIISVYDSIFAFLDTITTCYRKGIYYYGSEEDLLYDSKAEKELSKKINPKSAYWNLP